MTREEAIKRAEELADYDCYNEKQLKCAEEYRQLAEWLKELKQLREQTRWIPVTERLPDNSGRYWVNYSSGYVGIAHYYESVLKWGCTTTERIVAWMPLPKPYNTESEG